MLFLQPAILLQLQLWWEAKRAFQRREVFWQKGILLDCVVFVHPEPREVERSLQWRYYIYLKCSDNLAILPSNGTNDGAMLRQRWYQRNDGADKCRTKVGSSAMQTMKANNLYSLPQCQKLWLNFSKLKFHHLYSHFFVGMNRFQVRCAILCVYRAVYLWWAAHSLCRLYTCHWCRVSKRIPFSLFTCSPYLHSLFS